ncbi:hypothetical protein Scep_030344 [Stephania cephalantha]|uniref:Uncharacterized protein n=1 Tax=Stephania cephalantha TaxID=152367 RepID=A0AAP0E770_9MAGN
MCGKLPPLKTVRDVVLTVPVSFSRLQLTRIERACAMAGLHALRLMPEPTAVALLFSQQLQRTVRENIGSGSEKVALIFNMGAGYCDVCRTATSGGVSEIKGMAGSAIGGEGLLLNLIRFVAPFTKSAGLFRIAVQHAIHQLSFQDSATIEAKLGRFTFSTKINRTKFEEVNRKVFKVKNLVLNLCKKDQAYPGINQFESAVYGAALEGAVASGQGNPVGNLDLLSKQSIVHPLGIKADGNAFVRIMERNSAIPSRKELWFTTAHHNQTEALIMVYEGEGHKVEESHLLGYFKIGGIPPAKKGCSEVIVAMDIDASNALKVYAAASNPGSRQPLLPYLEVRMPNVDDGHG